MALNLAATAAAFGVAKLVFQDGVGAGALGLEAQGFVDAWAPMFFFCLIFALAMDYTMWCRRCGCGTREVPAVGSKDRPHAPRRPWMARA